MKIRSGPGTEADRAVLSRSRGVLALCPSAHDGTPVRHARVVVP